MVGSVPGSGPSAAPVKSPKKFPPTMGIFFPVMLFTDPACESDAAQRSASFARSNGFPPPPPAPGPPPPVGPPSFRPAPGGFGRGGFGDGKFGCNPNGSLSIEDFGSHTRTGLSLHCFHSSRRRDFPCPTSCAQEPWSKSFK